MPSLLKKITIALAIATAGFTIGYKALHLMVLLTLAITAGTTLYHFVMRYAVSGIYNAVMHNRADYRKWWYRARPWEQRLYELLRVKQWKKKMPTYDASLFDPRVHTWEEIAQAMCQAELVHETIAFLGFVPILAGRWFGATVVFVVTSVIAAIVELGFVTMQRYNRQRVMKICNSCVSQEKHKK